MIGISLGCAPVENHTPFELNVDVLSSTAAKLKYAAERFEDVCAGAPPIENIILGLKALASVAPVKGDIDPVKDLRTDRVRDALRLAATKLGDVAPVTFLHDLLPFAMAAATGLLIPDEHDDTHRSDRIDVVCQFIAVLGQLYFQRRIEARGDPLFRSIRSSAGVL